MKTLSCLTVFTACSLVLAGEAGAQFTGHYPMGVEGVKGGTLPPPGLYLRDYNLFYGADDLAVAGLPPGFVFDIEAVALAPRLVWISEMKLLGGYYGADVLVPFGYVEWEQGIAGAPGYAADDYFGIGDIFVEPVTLSWHGDRYDAGVGYGFWIPSGDFDAARPALLWKGFWSHMFTVGTTWYPDAEKTWSVSLLNRYEFHHEHEDSGIRPGQTLTMEWGLSKALTKTLELGLSGYYQQQTTGDSGVGASGVKDHVVALGPEVNVFWPKAGLFTSLRYNHEIDAQDRPEGHSVTLTLTKGF
ncbi:MAG: transporter [Verrucomicrobiales bacterium]|nr:transporter [Verrucomicrobiales bacterium]